MRRFAAVSEACRVHALENYKLRPQQVVTAYNGVTVRPTRAPPRADHDGVVVVGTLSNLIEEKGHEDLLAAVHELKEQGVPVALRVAGSGRLRDRLEALSSALGLADRVEFLGSVTSTDGFYRTIDLFVVPSVAAEGLPTTILEAMAANLPVVATAIGGSVEAISDGKEGLIVPARDPGALAAAIGHLISNPDLRHEMGSNGRKTVERQFSIARMTDTIVRAVYEPSLAAAANGAPGGL